MLESQVLASGDPADREYMRLALRLARRGMGRTSPNPMVGAVIVKDGRIIGQGYHHYFGGDHAEIDAIKSAAGPVSGATVYVTLEPCAHYGKKTSPCVDALLQSGIREVVAATLDPNPLVNGKGMERLRQNGIQTRCGVLENEARRLNAPFFKLMQTGRPLVTLKYAQTLDGRIAVADGSSRWISSEPFRRLAHRLRASHDAVMIGIGTVLADDPELTVRLARGRNPLRIVIDSSLRLPLDAKLVTSAAAVPTLVATTARASAERVRALREAGVEVLTVPADQSGELDLKEMLGLLGKRGVSSVLAEGGSGIITSLLRAGLADRLVVAVAPKIMGRGIEAVGDLRVAGVGQALKLRFERVYRLGEDIVIQAGFL